MGEHRHVPRPARNLQKVAKLAQSSQELKRPNPVMHLHAGKTGDNGVHALYLAVALEPRLGPNLALLHQLEVWLAQKNLPRSKVLHVMLQLAGKTGVKSRTRNCIAPADGGLACPAESTETENQHCETNPCCSTSVKVTDATSGDALDGATVTYTV